MARTILVSLMLVSLIVGCSQPTPPTAVWVEGEAFVSGPRHVADSIADKPPASGGQALYGSVLAGRGGHVEYLVTIPRRMPDARMVVRYSRHHWRPMDPAEVAVTMVSRDQGLVRRIVMEPTGGWGTTSKAEWGLASVEVGTLQAGRWGVQFAATAPEHGDVNIDGFFLLPSGLDVTTAELNAADRIHISGRRYVGVSVPKAMIHQQNYQGFDLPARAFVPADLDVTVTLLDDAGQRTAVLLQEEKAPIRDGTRAVLVPGGPLRQLPDGQYAIRAEWQTAPPLTVPVFLVGQFATKFDQRLAAIATTLDWLRSSEDPAHAAHVADYTHAVDFLKNAWADVMAATADKARLANIRRTLDQYETTTQMLRSGHAPYARRTGDFRLAFVSEATGRVEEYRLFLPDTYSPVGKTPVVMALNHHVDRFLDYSDGITKRIANARGYAILAPGAVGTDGTTAVYQDDGEKDLAQLLRRVLRNYPGIDRTRVYATGPSRGGFGTYSFATAHPEFFAAIACAAGTGNWRRENGQRVLVEQFAPMPTLILHGGIDNIVTPDVAEQVAAALADRGIEHELHIFPSHGHSYGAYAEQYLTMTLEFFDRYTNPDATNVDLTAPTRP